MFDSLHRMSRLQMLGSTFPLSCQSEGSMLVLDLLSLKRSTPSSSALRRKSTHPFEPIARQRMRSRDEEDCADTRCCAGPALSDLD